MRCALLLTLILATPAAALAAARASEPALPNGLELALLDRCNRLRADPQAAIPELLWPAQLGMPGQAMQIDWQLVKQELAELRPAPALVMDLGLWRAARGHARYLAVHQVTGHDQQPGTEVFTGATPAARAQAAGVGAGFRSENSFTNSRGVDNALQGFLIDWGDGPGGLLPGRGHRISLLDPAVTRSGMALVAHGQNFYSCVQTFARPDRGFLHGGVVWRDADADGRFDPDEGLAVQLAGDGGLLVKTWPSGGYVIAAPAEMLLQPQAADGERAVLVWESGHRFGVYRSWAMVDAATAAEIDLLEAGRDGLSQGEAAQAWWAWRHRPLPQQLRQALVSAGGADVVAAREQLATLQRALFWEGEAALRILAQRQPVLPGLAELQEAYSEFAVFWWQAVAFMQQVRNREPVQAGARSRLLREAQIRQRQAVLPELADAAEHVALLLRTLGTRP